MAHGFDLPPERRRLVSTIKAIIATLMSVGKCTASGTFSTTAAPSGGIVTSATQTITVPTGNTGELLFVGTLTGTITLQSNNNGAGFASQPDDGGGSLSDAGVIIAASGNSLALRITTASAGERADFDIVDASTGAIIEAVSIVAS